MPHRNRRLPDLSPLRIVLIYATLSILWISSSDRLLSFLEQDAAILTRIQTYKGLFFVVVSSLLLAGLIRRHVGESVEARRHTEEALRTNLNQMSTLFDAISVVISVSDMTTKRLIYLNNYGELLHGAGWQGKSFHAFIHEETEAELSGESCPDELLVIDGLLQPPCITEYRSRRNGRWYQRIVRAIRWTDGALVRMELLVDINEQRALERVKDDLLSTVSHEMQTPLTAMLGFTELLLEHPELSAEERRSCLETLQKETARLNDLITSYLDLQKLQGHSTPYDLLPFDPAPLLREAAALYAGGSKSHSVTVEAPERLPFVLGDEMRLAQVLGNLLSNAIRYSPAGGRVVLAAVSTGENVEVTVRDEGLGIPADAREKIFERFYRVDSSDRRRIGGTGIGLALVKEIVAAHGGSIRVESILGEGSAFTVVLPVAEGSVRSEE